MLFVLALLGVSAGLHAEPGAAKRNVIILVADGTGFNAFAAASMYQGKWDAEYARGTQVYNGPDWKQLAVQTFPLNTSKKPQGTGLQEAAIVYDPPKAWDRKTGYDWLKGKYTDSAASATALSTGHKTFNNAINWSDLDQPLKPTMSEFAKALGMASGVVTSVEWSHATPAGFSNAHSAERDEYQEIALQMLHGGVLDVIMGAGNPDFDNDGKPWQSKKSKSKGVTAGDVLKGITGELVSGQDFKYVGGKEAWTAIEAARAKPGALYQGFRPVSTKAEFEALREGPAPAKVLGTAQVATTLQQARTKSKTAKSPAEDTPPISTVPSLTTMAQGALNVLSQNPKGFFLMIEGGAVDWANHNNLGHRMVEEMIDFNSAVEAVVQWVETKSNWNETLVLITADHETGLIWGPNSEAEPFQPLANHGPGNMPGLLYHSKGHSNSLVPLFARGALANRFDSLSAGTDPVRGTYVDNTSLAKVMQEALAGTTKP